MADTKQIKQQLKSHFLVTGDVKIDPLTRVVNVAGDVRLRMDKKVQKLPLRFGNVGGDFYCTTNQLTSLEGAPSSVGGGFYCFINHLTSLAGAPSSVGGDFLCHRNPLTSLEGAPESVGGRFAFTYNPKLPLLRTLVAKKITCVDAPDPVRKILDRYAGQGNRGVLKAAAELIKAGFRDNARL